MKFAITNEVCAQHRDDAAYWQSHVTIERDANPHDRTTIRVYGPNGGLYATVSMYTTDLLAAVAQVRRPL